MGEQKYLGFLPPMGLEPWLRVVENMVKPLAYCGAFVQLWIRPYLTLQYRGVAPRHRALYRTV